MARRLHCRVKEWRGVEVVGGVHDVSVAATPDTRPTGHEGAGAVLLNRHLLPFGYGRLADNTGSAVGTNSMKSIVAIVGNSQFRIACWPWRSP